MKALCTLVVEDDAIVEGLGHTVCAMESNVANAVAAASHWRPDLMIVDVGLGEASGIAAVREILRSGFVPHVFATGDKVRGMPSGPDTVFIQMPSACRTWIKRYKERLRRRRVATASWCTMKRMG